MESMQLNSLNAIEPALAEGVTIEPEIVSEAIPSRATNIEIDITNEMSTPYAPNEITPKVGMSFASIDATYEFYNNYAWYCGFSTRKNTSRKAKSGEILRQILTCSRAGPGQEKRSNKGGFVSRCSCPAKLYLNFNRDGNTYDVSQFLPMHNHALCTLTKTRKLRSHKKLIEDDLGLISSLKASGIGVARSINFMRHEVGGSSHLHFSERDARNALRRKRQMMFGGDANSLLRYFQQKSQENSQFSYEIQVDEEMRLTSCFWVDGKSKEDYMVFGDVICFDTTYKTNEYDMPFGPFVGVNHHKQSILLGAGLLFGETIEDFKWLFQIWVHAMGGVNPKTIITDQDAAIGVAVQAVFPNSNHMLCLWHICKKLPEKLSHVIHDHPTFKTKWNHCLYGTESEDDFEDCWQAMIDEFNLQENAWLAHMYEIRRKWIPTFTRKYFSAGMRTTGRSESMNAFFDGFVNHKSNLIDFAHGYDKALERRREAEGEADFRTLHGIPLLRTTLTLEAQMAKVYTLNVFLLFQKEMEQSLLYFAERVEGDSKLRQWRVHHCEEENENKQKFVKWNAEELVAECPCMKFESLGIICKHILAILRFLKVKSMPHFHIMARWTQTAKSQFKFPSTSNDNESRQSLAVHNYALLKWWCHIRREALHNLDAFEIVKVNMEKMITALDALPKQIPCEVTSGDDLVSVEGGTVANDNFGHKDALESVGGDAIVQSLATFGAETSHAYNIDSPHITPRKSRSSKRMKGALEALRGGSRRCRGCNKFVIGHDKRNCPALNNPNVTIVSESIDDTCISRSRGHGQRGGVIDMASTAYGKSSANTSINCTCACGKAAIMLTSNTKRNPGRRFLRCPYFRDPVRCCNFFRWVDQFFAPMRGDVSMEESRTKVQVERQVHPFNHDEIVEERQLLPFNNHDEIVADIGEVVHCVTNLREIQIAEIHEIKQMQKATTDELKDKMEHLKEIIIMRDGELKKAFEIRDREILNLKRAMMIVVALVAIVVVVNCYLLL